MPPKTPPPPPPRKPRRSRKKPAVAETVKPTPGSTVRTRTRTRAAQPPAAASVREPKMGRVVREDEVLHTCGDCKPTRDDNKYLCVCKKSLAREVLVPRMSPEKVSVEAGVRKSPVRGAGVRGLPSGGKGILILGLLAVGIFAYSRMSGSTADKAAA